MIQVMEKPEWPETVEDGLICYDQQSMDYLSYEDLHRMLDHDINPGGDWDRWLNSLTVSRLDSFEMYGIQQEMKDPINEDAEIREQIRNIALYLLSCPKKGWGQYLCEELGIDFNEDLDNEK